MTIARSLRKLALTGTVDARDDGIVFTPFADTEAAVRLESVQADADRVPPGVASDPLFPPFLAAGSPAYRVRPERVLSDVSYADAPTETRLRVMRALVVEATHALHRLHAVHGVAHGGISADTIVLYRGAWTLRIGAVRELPAETHMQQDATDLLAVLRATLARWLPVEARVLERTYDHACVPRDADRGTPVPLLRTLAWFLHALDTYETMLAHVCERMPVEPAPLPAALQRALLLA